MEDHGHLQLEPEIRERLLTVGSAMQCDALHTVSSPTQPNLKLIGKEHVHELLIPQVTGQC